MKWRRGLEQLSAATNQTFRVPLCWTGRAGVRPTVPSRKDYRRIPIFPAEFSGLRARHFFGRQVLH